jgi:nicotinate-nucleotide adenylyltransferase
MMAAPRVAVFGGTFDPFHLGHLAVAEQARDGILAGATWVVPAGVPPLRGPVDAGAEDRLAMCRAGIDARDHLRVLDLELRRPGPSYTIDTMRDLAAAHPEVELWVVLGADAARQMPEWHGAGELLAGFHFVLVNRAGEPPIRHAEAMALGFHPDRTRVVGIDSPDVSATEIRRRVAVGEPLSGLVSPAVERLIVARGLYGPSPGSLGRQAMPDNPGS